MNALPTAPTAVAGARRARVRPTAALAWSLWVVWAALSALALRHVSPVSDAGTGFMVVGYATVGALIASRRPRNAVGWLMLALALV
ncbi:MAG TPA: hypothetical protein VF049_06410, partial [Nocardioidaceae bacterium]